jgi:hypothetical protein
MILNNNKYLEDGRIAETYEAQGIKFPCFIGWFYCGVIKDTTAGIISLK